MSQRPNKRAQEVLDYIKRESQKQGKTAFLKFAGNKKEAARVRLSFALCMAPLAMGLSDWFLHSIGDFDHAPVPKSKAKQKEYARLRSELQKHIDVDENHWEWFLSDLKILGLDKTMPVTDALRFLWGPHAVHSRMIIYKLIALSRSASPIMRFTALETFEEGAAVAFALFREAGVEICTAEGKPALSYFGVAHKEQEEQHGAANVKSIPELISEYKWTAREVEEAKTYVDEVCQYYTNLGKELHAYALKAKKHGGNELWPLASKKSA